MQSKEPIKFDLPFATPILSTHKFSPQMSQSKVLLVSELTWKSGDNNLSLVSPHLDSWKGKAKF